MLAPLLPSCYAFLPVVPLGQLIYGLDVLSFRVYYVDEVDFWFIAPCPVCPGRGAFYFAVPRAVLTLRYGETARRGFAGKRLVHIR